MCGFVGLMCAIIAQGAMVRDGGTEVAKTYSVEETKTYSAARERAAETNTQDPRGAKTASWLSDSDELQKRMNKKFGTQSARAVGARSAGRPTRGPDSLTGRAMALLEQRPAFESTNNLVFRRKTAALARAKTP